MKKLLQLHDMTVIDLVDADTLTKEQKKEALRLWMSLKKKREDSIKGRGCADGQSQQEHYNKEDATSPTVALKSVLITGVVDTYENRDVATVDIPGAFLQVDLDEDV